MEKNLLFFKKTIQLTCLLLLFFQQKMDAATITSTANGNWMAGATWVDGIVPDAGDDVVIAAGTTVTLDALDITVNALSILGTIDGANNLAVTGDMTFSGSCNQIGDLNIGGTLNWTGGTFGSMTATGIITIAGLTTISSNAHTLQTKTLVMDGGCVWSGGNITFLNNPILRNPATKIFSATVLNATISSGGTFENNGAFIRTNSATNFNTVAINSPFINAATGSITVNSSKLQLNNTVAGAGSITIATAGRLDCGDLDYSNILLVNNGSIINGGTFKFNGTFQQTISGTGLMLFVELDNPSGLVVTGQNYRIAKFRFTNGKVFLNNDDLLFDGGGPSTIFFDYDENKYFVTSGIGRLVITVSDNLPSIFPIGPNASSFNPVTLTKTGTNFVLYGVRCKVGFDPDKAPGGPDYVNRQWQIDKTLGAANPAVEVKFQWNSPTHEEGTLSTTSCHISRWNGTAWQSFGNAAASCASGICTRTQTGITTFSPFGVASGTTLPIELTAFRGFEEMKTNHFTWQTATETNTKTHRLERSKNGQTNWQIIAQRAGAGTTAEPSFYEADDLNPAIEAYYRVVFIDFEEKTDVSPIVVIKRKTAADGQFSIFPNPIRADGFFLNLPENTLDQPLDLQFFDAAGRFVFSKKIESADGQIFILTEKALPAGAYFLKIYSENKVTTLPILR